MKALVVVLAVLTFAPFALSEEKETKENPKVEDFLGKWTGKWDNTWHVQFTITQDAAKKEIAVLYEWEEQPGAALQRQHRPGRIEGNVLKAGGSIDISISAKDPNKGKAVGRFKTQRTADLTREKAGQ